MKMDELLYYNEYGGFNKEGNEYIITIKNGEKTPLPWTHILANEKFGTLITAGLGGYTWCGNSRENKLTVWSNNPVEDTSPEIIYMEDENENRWKITDALEYTVNYGFGYATFLSNVQSIEHELTIFVPPDEEKKISILKLKNNESVSKKLKLYYYINPVLGVAREYTKKHIITKKIDNNILLQNKYNQIFSNKILYVTSSELIQKYTCEKKEFENWNLKNTEGICISPCSVIQIEVKILPNEEKEILFVMGQDEKRIMPAISEAHNILEDTKKYWKEILDVIKVRTPVESMNIMLNGWLIYQTIVSRLYARTSFYQAGGAFGFRDQLQDTLALIDIKPEMTRKQIIYHSKHQYEEGDVQHWWHPEKDAGIRSRFSDDLLWMPYTLCEYIYGTRRL